MASSDLSHRLAAVFGSLGTDKSNSKAPHLWSIKDVETPSFQVGKDVDEYNYSSEEEDELDEENTHAVYLSESDSDDDILKSSEESKGMCQDQDDEPCEGNKGLKQRKSRHIESYESLWSSSSQARRAFDLEDEEDEVDRLATGLSAGGRRAIEESMPSLKTEVVDGNVFDRLCPLHGDAAAKVLETDLKLYGKDDVDVIAGPSDVDATGEQALAEHPKPLSDVQGASTSASSTAPEDIVMGDVGDTSGAAYRNNDIVSDASIPRVHEPLIDTDGDGGLLGRVDAEAAKLLNLFSDVSYSNAFNAEFFALSTDSSIDAFSSNRSSTSAVASSGQFSVRNDDTITASGSRTRPGRDHSYEFEFRVPHSTPSLSSEAPGSGSGATSGAETMATSLADLDDLDEDLPELEAEDNGFEQQAPSAASVTAVESSKRKRGGDKIVWAPPTSQSSSSSFSSSSSSSPMPPPASSTFRFPGQFSASSERWSNPDESTISHEDSDPGSVFSAPDLGTQHSFSKNKSPSASILRGASRDSPVRGTTSRPGSGFKTAVERGSRRVSFSAAAGDNNHEFNGTGSRGVTYRMPRFKPNGQKKSYVPDYVRNPDRYTMYDLGETLTIGGGFCSQDTHGHGGNDDCGHCYEA